MASGASRPAPILVLLSVSVKSPSLELERRSANFFSSSKKPICEPALLPTELDAELMPLIELAPDEAEPTEADDSDDTSVVSSELDI